METAAPILTPSEQRLLSLLPRDAGFSLADASEVLGARFKPKYLSELLSRLAAKGMLARLRNGFFYSGAAPSLKGVFAAAEYLHRGAYAACSTALYLHGVIDQRPAELVFATESAYGKAGFGGMQVRFVALGGGFYGTEEINGIRVSTYAKTFFDCLSRPKWCGGFDSAMALLEQNRLSKMQFGELAGYFKDVGNRRLAARIARRGRGWLPVSFIRQLDLVVLGRLA
ncbi:MAG: type IV toxin-antitoxin system AbiEi family antitoxin [Candidatus Micrarchaeota archaeon]